MPFYGTTPRGSRRATEPLAVAGTRKRASSAIVGGMRAPLVGATLILTVFAGPGLAACAALSACASGNAGFNEPRNPPAQLPRPRLPRVRLVATGGTISNRTGGRLTADELVNSMPGIERYVRAEFEQFANVSSGALTLEQWLDLARRINALFTEDSELAGIVVTSGTDTLEETAYFLHLTVRTDKPVVRRRLDAQPEHARLRRRGQSARGVSASPADPASRGKGVLVVLNDEINSAREVTKTDALRLDTFQSRGYGLLGVVDTDRVVYYRDVVKRHTQQQRVRRVAARGAAARRRHPDVSGCDGRRDQGGRRSGREGDRHRRGRRRRDERHAGRGHPVRDGQRSVRRHHHAHGRRTHARPEGPAAVDVPDSRIQGEDLAPVKARILLMLALTKTQGRSG